MITAIVLAAGGSTRMGEHKIVLPFGERTVIGHIIDELEQSNVEEILVVTGFAADDVAKALAQRNVKTVRNPAYESGMLSSVRTGLAAVRGDCRAVLIVLGDQPAISASVVDTLIAAFQADGASIVVPNHRGRRGHPLLVPMQFRDEIMTGFDDTGLRGLLYKYADAVSEIPVDDAGVLSDMDYPEDYERELDRHRRGRDAT